tara:strand:- start:824 stop:1216 length:393 start_codon:yes stop_codon:yes gene_type:complete
MDSRTIQIGGLIALLCLGACEDSTSRRAYVDWDESSADGPVDISRTDVSPDDALDRAAEEHLDATYDDLGRPYGCSEDCSGHEAGVKWARDNEVRDPGDCGGRSQSFIEGCEAYAEAIEQAAERIETDGY